MSLQLCFAYIVKTTEVLVLLIEGYFVVVHLRDCWFVVSGASPVPQHHDQKQASAVSAALNNKCMQVKEVLPLVPMEVIKRDLGRCSSVAVVRTYRREKGGNSVREKPVWKNYDGCHGLNENNVGFIPGIPKDRKTDYIDNSFILVAVCDFHNCYCI